jgi:Heavy metal associated domain 2
VKAKAQRVHNLPGRTRFKIPERRGDHAFFHEISELLRKFPSMQKVESNPLTGSFLLLYSGDIDSEPMQAALDALAEIFELEVSAPPVARKLPADVVDVDQAVQRFTHGALDLSTATALGLLVLAGVQLLRGQQPVIAVSLAWYATELLRRWEEPSHRGRDRPRQM